MEFLKKISTINQIFIQPRIYSSALLYIMLCFYTKYMEKVGTYFFS